MGEEGYTCIALEHVYASILSICCDIVWLFAYVFILAFFFQVCFILVICVDLTFHVLFLSMLKILKTIKSEKSPKSLIAYVVYITCKFGLVPSY